MRTRDMEPESVNKASTKSADHLDPVRCSSLLCELEMPKPLSLDDSIALEADFFFTRGGKRSEKVLTATAGWDMAHVSPALGIGNF